MNTRLQQANRRLTGKLLLLVAGMFAFGFALIPLYDVFCEVTGLNGKTGRIDTAEAQAYVPATDRLVTVEFVASLNGNTGRWAFKPDVQQMQVVPGELYTTHFFAQNLSSHAREAQAVPSLAPGIAAQYFHKTECFCFSRQRFVADEGREMPVTFVIDPALPAQITTVTLSYTFFGVDIQQGANQAVDTLVDSKT